MAIKHIHSIYRHIPDQIPALKLDAPILQRNPWVTHQAARYLYHFTVLEVGYLMVTWEIHPSQVSNGVEDKIVIVIASLVKIEIKLGTKFWIHQEKYLMEYFL